MRYSRHYYNLKTINKNNYIRSEFYLILKKYINIIINIDKKDCKTHLIAALASNALKIVIGGHAGNF